MAVSGTLSQQNQTLQKIYDHAFRRAGIAAQLITSEYLEIAKDCLNLTLSELVTDEKTLWTNDQILMGMQAGVPSITLPVGTLSVDYVVVRQATATTGALSGATPTWVLTATGAIAAQFVGVKVSTAGVYNLAVDSSPDGAIWTERASFEYQPLATGAWNWLEVVPDTPSVAHFRVRETSSPAVAFPVTAISVSIGSSERQVSPMGREEYANQPNKRQQGNVNSFWTDRRVDGPVLYLWNAPDTTHENYQLVIWRKRHIKDVGSMSGRVEIPQRWLDAMIWDLAWRLTAEIPDAKRTTVDLKPLADEAKYKIGPSETDGGSLYLGPDIGVYTR